MVSPLHIEFNFKSLESDVFLSSYIRSCLLSSGTVSRFLQVPGRTMQQKNGIALSSRVKIVVLEYTRKIHMYVKEPHFPHYKKTWNALNRNVTITTCLVVRLLAHMATSNKYLEQCFRHTRTLAKPVQPVSA